MRDILSFIFRENHELLSKVNLLTHFMPLVSFYTPWKIRKYQKETSGMRLVKVKQFVLGFIAQ